MKILPKKLKNEIIEATKDFQRHRENCVQCLLAFHTSELCNDIGYSLWLNAKRLEGLKHKYANSFETIHLKSSENI